jgi:SAM-dependent methyltransferase
MQVSVFNPTEQINGLHLRQAIDEEYSRLACDPESKFHFVTGWDLIEILDYDIGLLSGIPASAVQRFAGVGNPFALGLPNPGERVLDIGSGGGMDALIAAKLTGPQGWVTGIDITEGMVEVARENADMAGIDNVRFLHGAAESIPLPDHYVDLIISNGVINLCLDKVKVFGEMYRVLKPGGRIQIADVILFEPVGDRSKNVAQLWTNCVAGASLMFDYRAMLMAAGFADVRFEACYDVFSTAPVASSASRYGAMGWNIRAHI